MTREKFKLRWLSLALSVLVIVSFSLAASASSDDFAQDEGTTFENVSALIGPYTRSATGGGLGGIAWLDYDQDGNLDLYVTNSAFANNGLFRNNGDGTFTDVSEMAGVTNGTGNSGVVVGDIDNDGYPDIYLTGEGRMVGPVQTPARMYHNNGDGTFTDITATSGLIGPGSALAAAMGDINNDGYLDIFIASPGHIPALTGSGTGTSEENKLYLNNGDLTFTDISASAGVTGLYVDAFGDTVSDGACVASFSDHNNDGLADIFVGNCNAFFSPHIGPPPFVVRATPLTLYQNNGDGTFTNVAESAGLNLPGFWMGLAFGDYDNDGDIDLYATSSGTSLGGAYPHALFRNNGDGTYTEVSTSVGVPNTEFGWGVTFADFDNNGALDLYLVGALPLFGAIGPGEGNPGRLFFNDGTGHFNENEFNVTGVDLSSKYTSGLAQADFDGDGFIDMAVMTAPYRVGSITVPSEDFVLLRNLGNDNNWLSIRLVGTQSNRDGVGAVIRVKTGNHTQMRVIQAGSSFASSESPWPTFGLGKYHQAKITVAWPSGLTETFPGNPSNRLITLTEGAGHHKHKWQEDREEDETEGED